MENPNLSWIRLGKTGCSFATLFAKAPKSIGWIFLTPIEFLIRNDKKYNDSLSFKDKELIISILFPKQFIKEEVEEWALRHGFYEEPTSETTIGLRYKSKEGVSWVQYFGPDSHVKTRQAPQPMLMFTRKLNTSHYIKVGWKGILHLAHAWSKDVSEKAYNLLWERSYKQTRKLLGYEPTIKEAAKTTWLK